MLCQLAESLRWELPPLLPPAQPVDKAGEGAASAMYDEAPGVADEVAASAAAISGTWQWPGAAWAFSSDKPNLRAQPRNFWAVR